MSVSIPLEPPVGQGGSPEKDDTPSPSTDPVRIVEHSMKQLNIWLLVTLLTTVIVCVAVPVIALVSVFNSQQTQLKTTLFELCNDHVKDYEALGKVGYLNSSASAPAIITELVDFVIASGITQEGYGETGEVLLAEREGDQIHFLVPFRFKRDTDLVSWDDGDAEPMRLALKGKKGTIIARDYRGVNVMAAFSPVVLDSRDGKFRLGFVAKYDEQELNEPFYSSLVFAVIVSLILLILALVSQAFIFTPIDKRVKSEIKRRIQLEEIMKSEACLLEQHVEERTRELQITTNELLIAQKVAQSASAAKSAFLSNMSHELRTPLNGVIGLLTILGHSTLTPQQTVHLKMAIESSDSLLELVSKILVYAKLDAGKVSTNLVAFSLVDVIETTANVNLEQAWQQNVEIVLSFDPKLPIRLIGDPLRLQQIVQSILANAIKFSERKSFVGITITRAIHYDIPDSVHVLYKPPQTASFDDPSRCLIKIVVEDMGCGMLPSTIVKLCDQFTLGDESSTRRFGGVGLSLAIVHSLVKLMKGVLYVKSEVGKGTIFTVILPFIIKDDSDVVYTSDFCGKKVLVVDDVPLVRKAIGQLLNKWDISMIEADNLDMAASIIDDSLIDLCLIDSEFGTEIQSRLKKKSPQLPIGLMTHMQQSKCDYDHVLQKPVSQYALKAMLDTLLVGHSTSRTWSRILTPESPTPSPRQDLSRLKCLVVEDNDLNQLVVVGMLEYLGVVDVKLAHNGHEAISACEKERFDVVFMDCQMPLMDGYEATKVIRKREAASGKKPCVIIALTAHALPGDREACLAVGMDDYISKPVGDGVLERMLTKFC